MTFTEAKAVAHLIEHGGSVTRGQRDAAFQKLDSYVQIHGKKSEYFRLAKIIWDAAA